MRSKTQIRLAGWAIAVLGLLPSLARAQQLDLDLVTDRSASSHACGPGAIRWGFMQCIVARHGENVYAINFTRPPDVAWDVALPNEAPVAFWSRAGEKGLWKSVLLDGPHRTYQTPALLL